MKPSVRFVWVRTRRSLLANLVLTATVAAALLALAVVPHAQDTGPTAFSEAGCARCHGVEAANIEATGPERMRGPDLSTVGADHDEAWIIAAVKRETELERGRHPMPYRGTDDDIGAIASWLVGLD